MCSCRAASSSISSRKRRKRKPLSRKSLVSGVRAIVHKRGADGASYFDAKTQLTQPAFKVEEVDPTGAGDCFGATFVSCWLREHAPCPVFGLRRGKRSLGGDEAGPNGRRRHPGRSRRLSCSSFQEALVLMTRPLPPLVSRTAHRRPSRRHIGLHRASDRHRGGPVPRASHGQRVLIEATCNQVNQEGGYTGMTPADFRRFRGSHRGARRSLIPRESSWEATISAPTPGSICPPTRLCNGRKQ